jgi:hypothetical protein
MTLVDVNSSFVLKLKLRILSSLHSSPSPPPYTYCHAFRELAFQLTPERSGLLFRMPIVPYEFLRSSRCNAIIVPTSGKARHVHFASLTLADLKMLKDDFF